MLDIQGRKYASVTVCDVTLYDLVTKYPVMYFDTLKVTTLEGTAEVTDIQGGKGNATLASVSHRPTTNAVGSLVKPKSKPVTVVNLFCFISSTVSKSMIS